MIIHKLRPHQKVTQLLFNAVPVVHTSTNQITAKFEEVG